MTVGTLQGRMLNLKVSVNTCTYDGIYNKALSNKPNSSAICISHGDVEVQFEIRMKFYY